jgi:hypothetical protein
MNQRSVFKLYMRVVLYKKRPYDRPIVYLWRSTVQSELNINLNTANWNFFVTKEFLRRRIADLRSGQLPMIVSIVRSTQKNTIDIFTAVRTSNLPMKSILLDYFSSIQYYNDW